MRLAGHIGATPPRRRQRPRQLRISGPPLPPQVDDGTRHRERQTRGVGPFVPQTGCIAADRSPPTAIAIRSPLSFPQLHALFTTASFYHSASHAFGDAPRLPRAALDAEAHTGPFATLRPGLLQKSVVAAA